MIITIVLATSTEGRSLQMRLRLMLWFSQCTPQRTRSILLVRRLLLLIFVWTHGVAHGEVSFISAAPWPSVSPCSRLSFHCLLLVVILRLLLMLVATVLNGLSCLSTRNRWRLYSLRRGRLLMPMHNLLRRRALLMTNASNLLLLNLLLKVIFKRVNLRIILLRSWTGTTWIISLRVHTD